MSSTPTRQHGIVVVLLNSLMLLAACGHEQVRRTTGPDRDVVQATSPASRAKTAGEAAAIVAVRQVGVPYRYGGASTNGFDCSGLVQYAYAKAGKRVPRTTGEQWRQLKPVAAGQLLVGDVLFFNIDGRVSHVGLYLGSGRFVHAPSSGREVSIAELDSSFYRGSFVRGGRP